MNEIKDKSKLNCCALKPKVRHPPLNAFMATTPAFVISAIVVGKFTIFTVHNSSPTSMMPETI